MLRGFKDFLLRGNVIDLAVAVVIGAAFTGIVNALVKDLITPMIGALGGQPDFSRLSFTIHRSRFLYGDFINNVINFLIAAAAIYFLVVLPIKRMSTLRQQAGRGNQAAAQTTVPTEELITLRQIRDALLADRAHVSPGPAAPQQPG